MNIVSIDQTRRLGGKWAIEQPSFIFNDPDVQFEEYEVQKGEDMRIDLVMESIYGGEVTYANCDILLYINGIDNPLDIREGMKLKIPLPADIEEYRYEEPEAELVAASVIQKLGVPNKTTRRDNNRKKFLDADYSLPPTVMRESRPGVVVTPTEILIGGIK